MKLLLIFHVIYLYIVYNCCILPAVMFIYESLIYCIVNAGINYVFLHTTFIATNALGISVYVTMT